MKKILGVLFIGFLAITISSCGGGETKSNKTVCDCMVELLQLERLEDEAITMRDPDKMELYEAKDKKWVEECAPVLYPDSRADRIRVENQMRECQY
ncbi:MAG: hypothetical protein P8O83_05955 [Flavobacteriaceae bacterium]|nr:hypothetical protein [Flavobacteriaceae bacterium]